jgi:hypothetical protein
VPHLLRHGTSVFKVISARPVILIGCRSLVVVLSLSIREVVSKSPARACRVKPKTFKIGSDCSFAKSTAFRSENNTGLLDMILKTEVPCRSRCGK